MHVSARFPLKSVKNLSSDDRRTDEGDLHRFFHGVKSEHKRGTRTRGGERPVQSALTLAAVRSSVRYLLLLYFPDSLCSDNDVADRAERESRVAS